MKVLQQMRQPFQSASRASLRLPVSSIVLGSLLYAGCSTLMAQEGAASAPASSSAVSTAADTAAATPAAAGATVDRAAARTLAKESGCTSCHAEQEKLVGPAFQSVAAKYAGDSTAAQGLVQSIKNGSQGKWGRIPMPGHGSLPASDIETLAQYVLTVR